MKQFILLLACISISGCATSDKRFRSNVQSLIDCEYKYASKYLTCQQIYDLQQGCYALFKMRAE